jgi:hypothetical protein
MARRRNKMIYLKPLTFSKKFKKPKKPDRPYPSASGCIAALRHKLFLIFNNEDEVEEITLDKPGTEKLFIKMVEVSENEKVVDADSLVIPKDSSLIDILEILEEYKKEQIEKDDDGDDDWEDD